MRATPMSQTTLRHEALNLLHVLKAIDAEIRSYAGRTGLPHVAGMSASLESLLPVFEKAVLVDRDRAAANSVFGDIHLIVSEASAQATKGDLPIFSTGRLDRYWELSTIFQETRFRGEAL